MKTPTNPTAISTKPSAINALRVSRLQVLPTRPRFIAQT